MASGKHIIKNGKLRTGLLCVAVLLAVFCVRSFCVGSYRISTASMENSLHKGDYVLVNKLPVQERKRNQVLLFTSPLIKDQDNAPLLVSRCIALPGDTIQVSNAGYSVNGVLYPRSPNTLTFYKFEQSIKTPFLKTLQELGIPQRDMEEDRSHLSLRLTSFEEYRIREELTDQANKLFTREEAESYRLLVPRKGYTYRLSEAFITACREALSAETGGKAEFRDKKLFLDGVETTQFRFSQDYYWVLSDNVKEAVDSRHLGFIPAGHIIGNAWFCWYSPDKRRAFKKIN
ncbi:MAG: signal peptidase I [Tannerellaceae bacterium]|jgi:signal peptidase I|nr:signal peptidase I [Tannerellaceae bacterium]